MNMMQGDAGCIPVRVRLNGTVLAPADVSDVEITVGDVPKRYADGVLRYDTNRGAFLYPYSQRETFDMDYSLEVQVRIKLLDDATVIGGRSYSIPVDESLSQEVL